jgi:hypothetical protein
VSVYLLTYSLTHLLWLRPSNIIRRIQSRIMRSVRHVASVYKVSVGKCEGRTQAGTRHVLRLTTDGILIGDSIY